jgi:hypothetical protein
LLTDRSKMCNLHRGISFDVLEEKIKMWKVNGWRTTDAKWWQKLILPLTMWAKNYFKFSIPISISSPPMSNVYYPGIDTVYRCRMSTHILHWTSQLLIMSEMMTRVHLANMINVYNREINIIYRCNRFYIGPLNHCFLSEIMTRVYIDVTEIHL